MDSTRAWNRLLEICTDGTNVWATGSSGVLLSRKTIGQDIDGFDVAVATAVAEVAREAMQVAERPYVPRD